MDPLSGWEGSGMSDGTEAEEESGVLSAMAGRLSGVKEIEAFPTSWP